MTVTLLKDRANALDIDEDPTRFAKLTRIILAKLNYIVEGDIFIPSTVMINRGDLTP